MNLDLADILRCPREHDESPLVVMTKRMDESEVLEGVLGCPICHEEFPIKNGVADFGSGSNVQNDDALGVQPDVGADAICAMLGLVGGGGHVMLAGLVGQVGADLMEMLDSVRIVGFNLLEATGYTDKLSTIKSGLEIWPFRSSMFRGVVVGSQWASSANISEARRILLKGQRLIVFGGAGGESDMECLVADAAVWVGVKP